MVFSSLIFLFLFLPVNLAVYYAVPRGTRNAVLLITSLAFYGWGEPLYIAVMLFSISVAYIFGYFTGKYRETNRKRAKLCLTVSTVLNLAALLFFKYYNFFAETFGGTTIERFILTNFSVISVFVVLVAVCVCSALLMSGLSLRVRKTAALAVGVAAVAVIAAGTLSNGSGTVGVFLSTEITIPFTLPIGISFYTFQIMSYTFDVYRGDGSVQRSIVPFAAYVTLFPQLIAGPIVRYHDVDEQLSQRTHSFEKFACGVRTFTAGLAKKVILADGCAALKELLDATGTDEPTVVGAWMAVVAFSFQLYFDFSGYSDMAIGLGRMFGFEFLENFNYPYISSSITDFWRRWHISLSTWFKEYLYIPLGGNRKGLARQYLNIATVWLVTGFWHGAAWNYVLWGAYFGVLLIIEKAFLLKRLERAPAFLRHAYALLFILIGWLIFAYEDMSLGLSVLRGMFGIGTSAFVTDGVAYDILRFVPLLLICVVGSTPLPKRLYRQTFERGPAMRAVWTAAGAGALLLCVAYMVDSTFSPFLYFIF